MKKQKPAADEAREILVMRDGRKYPLIGRSGPFYLVEGAQFRTSNPRIAGIRRETSSDKEALAENSSKS